MVAAHDIVLADETSKRMQTSDKRAFIWTFLADNPRRLPLQPRPQRADAPRRAGGTRGTLVVDMYTGYNSVVGVDSRERAGYLAHARRKFFDALADAPEAQFALDRILEV